MVMEVNHSQQQLLPRRADEETARKLFEDIKQQLTELSSAVGHFALYRSPFSLMYHPRLVNSVEGMLKSLYSDCLDHYEGKAA